ncbi:FecR domain-containing protein [Sphaerotilus microaerophilus]|uniref:FecR family protein n=1 Tax=Sphaerotilus microaerophilus TaxID=2914710 RepID=A0ABN6PJM4_9BURK|nr:FecR domain-containing protein [Sphaerotilus sp. FB-5]BDI05301.1 hypothetical protein CATMQ487_22710 [Sphaerotilus sp. FB-5]
MTAFLFRQPAGHPWSIPLAVGAALVLAALPAWAGEGAVPADPVFTYTTSAGDTLIGLGKRFLVDPARWPELAKVNRVPNANRIPTGQTLAIPLRLMATQPAPGQVLSASGEVQGTGQQPVLAGQALPPGAELRTGEGQATVRLADGTLLHLRAGSQLVVDTAHRVTKAGVVQSGVTLQRGQVDVQAQKAPAGMPGFRVGTPQGVLGVRGTEFRVRADEQEATTRGEVLEGAVAVDGLGGQPGRPGQPAQPGQRVQAGQGVVVDRSGQVALPVALLAAPDLSALPLLQERPLVRFTLAPQAGAVAYRAQVATEGGFATLAADVRSDSTELRIAGLPDGDHVMRVLAEDAQGLQGLNAEHRFRLKARPEPPLPSAPQPRTIIAGQGVQLAWTANPEARSYRLQLAQSEDFSQPLLRDLRGHEAAALALDGLAPGVYFWRLASERSATDQGPFGAAQRFEMRAIPKPPAPPEVGDRSIRLAWEGLPGQTFEVQFARAPDFAPVLLERRTRTPALEIELPGGGRFFVRVRALDPDGFVGPYSSPQQFQLPTCLRDGQLGCVKADGQSVQVAD